MEPSPASRPPTPSAAPTLREWPTQFDQELHDVLVARGEPQQWGTQMGCGPDGPAPATPITDESTLDERRASAGLEPYAEYLAEMTELCAQLETDDG